MRRIAQLLTVLLTVLYCSPAHAVVDPYEALEITPAEGEVTSLQHFTITFAGLPVEVNQAAVPTLQKGGGATHQGSMRADADGTTVLVDFDECFTASGHYFLNLPEGSLTVNGQRLLPLTLRFSIAGDMDSFYDQITIDPVEGEVEKLQYFTISFPEYVGEIADGSKATLVNTTTNKTYRGEMLSVGYTAIVYLADELTEAGDYTLTVPAGAVVFYTLDEEVHELNFDYTIAGDTVPSFYDQITIDPAEGIVESLQHFTITFPMQVDGLADDVMATVTCTTTGTTTHAAMSANGNHVDVNLAEEVTEPGRYALSIPAGAVLIEALGELMQELNFNYLIPEQGMPEYTINPPEGEVNLLQVFTIDYDQNVIVDEEAIALLTNDETGEAFDCNMWEIGGNAVIYKEYPLSVVGNYTLTVPAGCIIIEATGQTNPEMVFHYNLTEKDTYVPPVIENQPEGELKLYMRSGLSVREVEKDEPVAEDEYPYEIIQEPQSGALSIVFAPDNKVYIQRPVSTSYYDGWVEGSLSEDGKTITVPMGQYIAYAKSLEMAVQVGMFAYIDSLNTYMYDPTIQEVTYTIHDNGSISQNGSSVNLILGTMNRVFGDVFQYLDYEWLQSGDFESVYSLATEQPATPPDDLVTDNYYLTTAVNDGMDWDSYATVVAMGFDGNDVWLKGISGYLPDAWIKGVREGNKLTFPNPQLLGSYESLFYFKCANYNPLTGITTQKDLELTLTEDSTYTTFDYVFITVDKDELWYVNYYQGLTISRYNDVIVTAPENLELQDYTFHYKTKASAAAPLVDAQIQVKVGFSGDNVYIRGMWEYAPNSWVVGTIVDGELVLALPQFFGNFMQEYESSYPIYLTAFDINTGLLLPQVKFTYHPENRSFTNASAPMSIGINKTGYLSLQDYFEGTFIPEESGVAAIMADDAHITGYYDLQGRRLDKAPDTDGIYIVTYSDGTSRKVLKK